MNKPVSVVTVKTIGNLHYLYNRDVSLRQCFTPNQVLVAKATAERLNASLVTTIVRMN